MRFTALALACLGASLALADVDYTVRATPDSEKLSVTVAFRARPGTNALEIPNWSPGAYILSDNARNISGMSVTVGGQTVTPSNPKPYRWEFPANGGASVVVKYDVKVNKYADRLHYAGPPTYIYLADRKTEKCNLHLDLPAAWLVAVGLDAKGTGDRDYVAPTYDVLADNPVSCGRLILANYTVRGVPHTVAVYGGAVEKLDVNLLASYCKYVSQAEADFWGGLPFKKYIWHANVFESPDGGSGLEHLSSVELGVSTGMGLGLRSVLAHEYFHAWNVKRIRSRVLGPFDYNVLPKTGALWWLEGVTDYYASLMLWRYGMAGQDYLGNQVGRNYGSYLSNAAHTTISPYDASFRVGEANNGRGNSQGYQISYYTLGWLTGLCLDVELRDRTQGRVSLDDVVKQLFIDCNGKPGFEEGHIREVLVAKGGPAFGPIYDEWVLKPGNLPVPQQLAKLGLEMVDTEEPSYSFGLNTNATDDRKGLRVEDVLEPASTVLKKGDVLTKAGDQSLTGVSTGQGARSLDRAANDTRLAATNRVVKFELVRDGVTMTVDVPTRVTMRKSKKVLDKAMVTPDQRLLRTGVLYGAAPVLRG